MDDKYKNLSTEELIKRLKHTEKKLVESSNESERLKSLFLANISHEIRTPMNAILGFSGLLKNENISEEEKQLFIDGITDSTNKLLHIIDNILETAKIESKEITIKEEACNIDELLQQLFCSYNKHKGNIGKGHIELRFRKEANGHPVFLTDISKLNQILSNLIDNALKFTNHGHIEFGYEFIDDNNILFFVKDTGIGIPIDKYNDIFEKFNQVNSTYSMKNTGLGVGLSISNFFVQQLGGSMGLRSIVNKGTEFYFSLPFIAAEEILVHNNETEDEKSPVWIKQFLNQSNQKTKEREILSKYKIKAL